MVIIHALLACSIWFHFLTKVGIFVKNLKFYRLLMTLKNSGKREWGKLILLKIRGLKLFWALFLQKSSCKGKHKNSVKRTFSTGKGSYLQVCVLLCLQDALVTCESFFLSEWFIFGWNPFVKLILNWSFNKVFNNSTFFHLPFNKCYFSIRKSGTCFKVDSTLSIGLVSFHLLTPVSSLLEKKHHLERIDHITLSAFTT